MKAITRRLAKLEDRLARTAMPVGWSAKEELLKRLEGMRTRLLLEDRELKGDAVAVARQRLEEWLSDWHQRRDGRA